MSATPRFQAPRRSRLRSRPGAAGSSSLQALRSNRRIGAERAGPPGVCRMAEARRTLYPDIEPFDAGFLQVSPLHRVYYEQCGNPRGKPVVFLHGGPGAGCNAKIAALLRSARTTASCCSTSAAAGVDAARRARRQHDLASRRRHRALREHLGIERWQVFGGSWGSTLALAYAQTHPERVTELVLRGIFMLRRWELEWFYQKGAMRSFPMRGRNISKPIPEVERGDLMSAYHRRLTGPDAAMRLAAARAWSIWEGATSFLLPGSDAHRIERRGRVRARVRAHRMPLLRQRRLLRARRSAAAQRASAARDSRRDRAGPLRHRLSAAQRVGSAPRVAGSGSAHRRRCRTFGVRARDHARADRGDRSVSLTRTSSPRASAARRIATRKGPADAGPFVSAIRNVRDQCARRRARRP